MPLLPRATETLCHVCAALRVDATATDALQDAVADWLLSKYAAAIPADSLHQALTTTLADATELLALVARTSKAHRQPECPPF